MKLRPLQKKAVDFVCERLASLLLFQQRLGKTWIALGAIEKLRPKRTLIVVPLANKETTWADLIRKLLPKVSLTSFPEKVTRKKLREAVKKFTTGIFLVHFEALPGIIGQLRRVKWDFCIVDELHRCKDRNSLTSRTVAKLRHIPRKLGLTGTPMDEEPVDLWAQLRFVAPDLLGTRWLDFDEEYVEQPDIDPFKYRPGSIGFRRSLIKRAIAKRKCEFLARKLPKFLRIIKDVCWREELPSPKPRFVYEWVKLEGYQRRVYDTFKRKKIVRLRDGTRIMGSMELTKREKLNQMAGGYVIDDDGEVHRVGNAKLTRLRRVLRHRGRPAAIFCRYTAEIDAIAKAIGGRVGVLSGKVKDRRERSRTQRRFQKGKLDYIICQTRTGSVGIDLYRAKYLVIYSTTYSLIDFDQLVARIRLPEQKEPVNIILLLAAGTIDEDKHRMLCAKSSKVTGVLSRLKRGAKYNGKRRQALRRGRLRQQGGHKPVKRSRMDAQQ